MTPRGLSKPAVTLQGLSASALLDTLEAHVALLDAHGDIIEVNDRWRAFGDANGLLTPKHAVGVNYLSACKADFEGGDPIAAAAIAGITAVLTHDQDTFTIDYPCHSPSAHRWFRLIARRLHEAPATVAILHIPLTHIGQPDQTSVDHAHALNAVENAVVIADTGGRILWANASFTRTTGYEARDYLGHTTAALLHSTSHPTRFYDEMWDVLRRGEVWNGETVNRHKDGSEGLVYLTITPIRGEDRQLSHFIAISRDLTEDRQRTNAVLRNQRLESLGTLANGLAHNLNNALAPILMSLSVLRLAESAAERDEAIQAIEDSTRRAAQLVKQVFHFAQTEPGRQEGVDIAALANHVADELTSALPTNILFTRHIEPGLPPLRGDSGQIGQALRQLLDNAHEAMPMGGRLRLQVERAVVPAGVAGQLGGLRPGPAIRLSVSDTGVGIAPEARAHIFDPFTTTKEANQRAGLGLASAYAIVRNHGGLIDVRSAPGQGATFEVWLPADAQAPKARPKRAAPEAVPVGRGERILVVDDEEAILRIVDRTLTRFGYRVLTALHGAEAVAHFALQHDDVALVLTDMAMPVMDGHATILALRGLDPTIPIIGSSGQVTHSTAARAQGAGVDAFLPKPYTTETLLRAVREVLDARPRKSGAPVSGT